MRRPILLLAILALLLPTAGLRAQDARDADVRDELRALVTDGGAAEADRRTVAEFLNRDAVERAAARGSIDLERLRDGVGTLGADEAQRLADRVRVVEDQLAGGDTFVITSTTVIIALLVIILIIVA
jgi:hypothetical protein